MGWKEYTDSNTRDLIAESLRHLMMAKPFDVIRIKDICNEVGVVRVTFYNYFIDKFDTLDYLIKKDLVQPNQNLVKDGHFIEIYEAIVRTVNSRLAFYKTAFGVAGQNGFEDLMHADLSDLYLEMLDINRRPEESRHELTNSVVADYLSELTVYAVRQWLFHPHQVAVDDFIEYSKEMMNHSIRELTEPLRH